MNFHLRKILFLTFSVLSILGYGFFVFAAPPGPGGYNPGETLDPECNPGDLVPEPCIVKSSNWSLTGNTGTDGGTTNFVGTTDAQDLVLKTNGNEIARFGQNSNIAFGSNSTASASYSFVGPGSTATSFAAVAFGGGTASGVRAIAIGSGSTASGATSLALGDSNVASGDDATAFGLGNTASGVASIAFGYQSIASGDYSFAFGNVDGPYGTVASGEKSVAIGTAITASGLRSTVIGSKGSESSGVESIAIGSSAIATGNQSFATSGSIANGRNSVALLTGESNGQYSLAAGYQVSTQSFGEAVFGIGNTAYSPVNAVQSDPLDRLLSVGNGDGIGNQHNAYTLWKDGSFAFNDDNFQNDNPGIEQNMFYFNYGNHDGLGAVQTKRAVRLGSALSGEWDVDNIFVGDRSVAIGFAAGPSLNGPIARGAYSIALGTDTVASGTMSTAFGVRTDATGSEATAFGNSNMASGDNSTAFGPAGAIASGLGSIAFGNNAVASGRYTIAFGGLITARSYSEIAYGIQNTLYTPASTTLINGADRLVVIGNGNVIPGDPNEFSDAFTILKSGQTGIGIDNFEANTNGNIFQVGDGSTNIIGYVDDTTGNWVAVSDEHKKDNITDLSYGLNELIQLRPTSFNYKRNGEHTIGFLAQQVLPIIPEAVYGTESEGYGMSYATLTPVIVKAIQEMNLNITQLSDMTRENTWRDSLIEWFGTATNGITKLFAGEVHTDTLCVGQTCVTESQLQQLLQNQNIIYTTQAPTGIIEEADDTDPVVDATDPVDTRDSNQEIPVEEPVVDISDNLETSAPVLGTPTE